MSVTLSQTYETASGAIADGLRITSASEGAGHWFFVVGDSTVKVVPDSSPIVIDKQTGEASYPMPAVPSVVLGDEPLPIEIEAANAIGVPLPV